MLFLDSIDLYLSSGNGGNGCVSFNKLSNRSIGKPDGGNGGKGGDVYFSCDEKLKTFSNLRFNANYKAEDGTSGGSNFKTGKNGKDLYIHVPCGTLIYDSERSFLFGEILKKEDKVLVLNGGRPGYGNFFLKNSSKDIFDKLILGGKNKVAFFHLELKLLADVGLLGFPNVGKSLFLNKISKVNSKVANYPFTTLNPILGALSFFSFNTIIVADLPGIIENSSVGVGLGFDFLKHLLKTRLLLHIVDTSSLTSKFFLLKELFVINKELNSYNFKLLNIEKWLIFNKIDLVTDFNFFDRNLVNKFNYSNVFYISSKNNTGLKKLCFNIFEFFSKIS